MRLLPEGFFSSRRGLYSSRRGLYNSRRELYRPRRELKKSSGDRWILARGVGAFALPRGRGMR